MAPVNVVRPRVSFADLQRAPEDGRRYELYDGKVFVVPAPFARHQRVVQEVFLLLKEYADAVGGETLFSPIDIVFSEYDVIQPDVLYFRPERRDLIRQDEAIRSGPDRGDRPGSRAKVMEIEGPRRPCRWPETARDGREYRRSAVRTGPKCHGLHACASGSRRDRNRHCGSFGPD